MDARLYLDRKVRQAFAEEWDPLRPARVEVIGEGAEAGLRFLAKLHRDYPLPMYDSFPVALVTIQDVEGLSARALPKDLQAIPVASADLR